MDYKDFVKEIRDNRLEGDYFLEVEEAFLFDSIEKILKEDVVENIDFNFSKIDGEVKSPDEIITSLERLPVFSDKTYVIIENIDFTKNGIKKFEPVLKALSSYYENPNPMNVSIILNTRGKAFKSGKYFKKIRKNLKEVNIDRLNRREFRSFVGKFFLNSNKRISKAAIEYIIDESEYFEYKSEVSLFDVSNELKKIRDVSDGDIKIEDIDKIKLEKFDDNIFNFLDSLSIRDLNRSLSLYYDFLKKDIDEHFIFSMIIRQFRNIYFVKALADRNIYGPKAMELSGLKRFEYKKISNVNGFSYGDLREIYSYIFSLEKRRKTINPDMKKEVEILISRICTI